MHVQLLNILFLVFKYISVLILVYFELPFHYQELLSGDTTLYCNPCPRRPRQKKFAWLEPRETGRVPTREDAPRVEQSPGSTSAHAISTGVARALDV